MGWLVGLLAGVAAILGIGYVVGSEPAASKNFLAAELAALSSSGVSAVAAFSALALIGLSISRLRLEWSAWRPGTVAVAEFSSTEEIDGNRVTALTEQFRRQLASPVPRLALTSLERVESAELVSQAKRDGDLAQGDFLQVLGQVGSEGTGSVGGVLALARATFPVVAWEIRGSLVRREQQPSFGVTVTVARLPAEPPSAVTVWDANWEAAARVAAHHTLAAIIPRTRLCRAPWAAWRGYVMPGGLLASFQAATRLQRERAFDEALSHYYLALRLDPINASLRLQLTAAHERVGAVLDALATYHGMVRMMESPPRRGFGRRQRRARRGATEMRFSVSLAIAGLCF